MVCNIVQKRRVIAAVGCLVVLIVLFLFFHSQKQTYGINDIKGLSYFEYFYIASGAEISEITKTAGIGYGMSGGLGNHFGQPDAPLWDGTTNISPSLELTPYYLLRISDSQTTVALQSVDLTVHYVADASTPSISEMVDSLGFYYNQDPYIITSNGEICKIADESFFVDFFCFLDDESILPPKVE